MLHAFLAVYLFASSLGLVVIALSLLAYARSGISAFRHIALLYFAILLLVLCRILKTYELATVEHVFGGALPAISLALIIPGNGLLAYMVCILAAGVVLLPLSPARMAAYLFLAAGVAVVGGASVVMPQRFLRFLNDACLTAVQAYGVVLILGRIEKIRHPRLLALVRSLLAAAFVMIAAMIVQIIGQATLQAPPFLRDFPLVQVLFLFATGGLLLFYAAQYLFVAEFGAAYQLPEGIVKQYGISPREREIITMLVQGYTNRIIGEKLFISSTTVKNHIYHIYQKTGVTNKIQLMNLINSPK